MPPRSPIDHVRPGTGFLAATFDGFTALFSQSCILAIEQRGSLTSHDGRGATYSRDGINARVFALSRMLRPLPTVDRPYFFIAQHAGRAFGLACDELNVVSASRVRLKSIPASLRCGNSPIEAYAQFGDRIAFECSIAAIAALLPAEVSHASTLDSGCPV